MKEIRVNNSISYIEATDAPLSADIGMIHSSTGIWFYDVGSDPRSIPSLDGPDHVVLSHFHQDHTGNVDLIQCDHFYVSKETFRHIEKGTIVDHHLYVNELHIFPIPSSHCKGCLGLEVDEQFAFVGDALYCKRQGSHYVYNTQLLFEEIRILKQLKSEYLLVSHHEGLIRKKSDVIAELEEIYSRREKNSSEIMIGQ